MADQLFIGIDNGTQGTKCAVYSRRQRKLLASAYAPHKLIENDQGRREQEPQWWIDAATSTLDQALAAPGVDRNAIVAISVSGQQHGCVALDANGTPLRPAKLWCDTETVPQCERITAAVGGNDAVIAAIGNSVAAGFTASKVLWLRENEPALYAKLATVLLPHDYLNFWLTGERKTECGDASGTAYFDVRRRKWSDPLINAIDPTGHFAKCLPEVIAADEPIGTIRPEIARRFGLSDKVIVAAGGGDNMMAAIGTGNVGPGSVTASLGTSGTIFAFNDSPVIDPNGELAAFCSSSGGWMPLICTMNVTVATEQTRDLLGLDVKAFDALVAAAPAGAAGIRMLPYFNGERTPALPKARATISGISSTNFSRENIARAAMEGATLGLRYGMEILKRLNVTPDEIRLVGGGSKSAIWRRIAADIFGCPVVCPTSSEAAAMGCVVQAMWCYDRLNGLNTPITTLAEEAITLDPSTRIIPGPDTSLYNNIYDEYVKLNDTLAPLAL